MVQPASRRLVTESALAPLKTRVDTLDSRGQRGYVIDQSAGRVVKVWDYLNNREQMIYGYTGVRNIYALLEGATFTGGRVEVIREGNDVELTIYGITPGASVADGNVALRMPSGFRPPSYQLFPYVWYGTTIDAGNRALISGGGALQVYGWEAGRVIYGRLSWKTSDPWPTTLPGTAVGGVA